MTAPLIWLLATIAQDTTTLTLEQAQRAAVANHPSLASASLTAQATGEQVAQVKSALRPQLNIAATAVGADAGTTIAAGTLQAQGLATRAAVGFGISQLVTDFGRTHELAESARLRTQSLEQNIGTVKARILLEVERVYYASLSAQAVLKVMQSRVDMQRSTLRQIGALAESGLRSTLDRSFADVAVSDAELALFQAENAARAADAQLAAAMGEQGPHHYRLTDVGLPEKVSDQTEELVEAALRNRPELGAAKLNVAAAERLAAAEHRLRYPNISVLGAAGAVPFHRNGAQATYSAAGVNVTLPFLNGGLFKSRQIEAELRARSAGKDVDALQIQIAAAVRTSWQDADMAWQRLAVTNRMMEQTNVALRLAQSRYDAGLSGIVELTQSQLALVSAQVQSASAKYDYLQRIATLNFAIGALR